MVSSGSASRQGIQQLPRPHGFATSQPSSRPQGFTPASPSQQPPRPQGFTAASSSGSSKKTPRLQGQQGFATTGSSVPTPREHEPMDPFTMPWKPKNEPEETLNRKAQFDHYHNSFGHLSREAFAKSVEQEAQRIKDAGGWDAVKDNSAFLAQAHPL